MLTSPSILDEDRHTETQGQGYVRIQEQKKAGHLVRLLIYSILQNYSALGASSVVASVASAGASVAAADFLERRVRVAFLAADLAMFSL